MFIHNDSVAVAALVVVVSRAFLSKWNLARHTAPALSAVATVVRARTAVHAHDVIDAALHVAHESVPALFALALETAAAVRRSVYFDLTAHSVTGTVPDTVTVVNCKHTKQGINILFLAVMTSCSFG